MALGEQARREGRFWNKQAQFLLALCLVPIPGIGLKASYAQAARALPQPLASEAAPRVYLGFDRNDYPGDAALPALRKIFDFAGYWLNNPLGALDDGWHGKRAELLRQGFGFLVLSNGRLYSQIKAAQLRSPAMSPAALGAEDAAVAVTVARGEGFPPGTILFLDQEEGGRLLAEQAAYLLGWTEAVSTSGYRAGVYASGQPVNEGHGVSITTALDIEARVKAGHLHEVALWVAEDACPPSPGCRMIAKPGQPLPSLEQSGTSGAIAWQYAQSPRRKGITASCGASYSRDGNCRVPGLNALDVDLTVANSPDPSHGR